MEAGKFFLLLKKRWYILIAVPIISMAVTYMLVKDMPGSYRSQAKISTGIVDETQKALNNDATTQQESQINQEFSNLIEMMKLKKIVDQLSYTLIIHDLTAAKPYRAPSKLMQDLTPAAKNHALEVYKEKFAKEEPLNLGDGDQNGLNQVLKSMKYDEESIKSQLSIYRLSNSDFIYVEYASENPDLSAFIVNTLCDNFLRYYTRAVKENEFKAANFLKELMDEKYQAMNEKIDGLKEYKINNKILNLYEQSKILYTHLMLVASEKDEAEKKIQSYDGALASIDKKFDPKDRRYLESSMTKVNQEILGTKDKMRNLSDKYIASNFEAGYKTSIDSLQKILSSQINTLTDKYIYDPLNTKKDLMSQKLNLEVQRDIEQNSLQTLNRQLALLNERFNRLVPFEAVVQSYERDIDVTTREYLEVLNKYNQTNMASGFSVRLRQVQQAMPGAAEPSKKMILVILAGIVSFVFCLLVFFLMFLFDHSITKPSELVQKTQQTVLGHLNYLRGSKAELYNIWRRPDDNSAIVEEKRLFRSLRFEISRSIDVSNKVLCITSLSSSTGKTFTSINLAYALAMMKIEVLLVDGNFANPTITQTLQPTLFIEDFLQNGQINFNTTDPFITVAGNRGGDRSLLELGRQEKIQDMFNKLPFDVVIIETESLDTDNKSKEWLLFASKISAVFESGTTLNNADEQRIAYLASTGKFEGWIMNKVKA